nr:hypothetical protein [Amycolatopsis dendrobii]
MSADVCDEAGAELDGRVVPLNRVFDVEDVDVRRVAGATLLVPAEEVGVLVPARVDGVLDDHARRGAVLLAAAAEQRPFEVVVMHASALLCGGS